MDAGPLSRGRPSDQHLEAQVNPKREDLTRVPYSNSDTLKMSSKGDRYASWQSRPSFVEALEHRGVELLA
ncbi:MAG: hypothetical protein M0Z40_15635, partial [Actinomycetota bacterium]|nr:hypothetical protein [Actinomycetota bacterium]